jgi:hypothetical protein
MEMKLKSGLSVSIIHGYHETDSVIEVILTECMRVGQPQPPMCRCGVGTTTTGKQ